MHVILPVAIMSFGVVVFMTQSPQIMSRKLSALSGLAENVSMRDSVLVEFSNASVEAANRSGLSHLLQNQSSEYGSPKQQNVASVNTLCVCNYGGVDVGPLANQDGWPHTIAGNRLGERQCYCFADWGAFSNYGREGQRINCIYQRSTDRYKTRYNCDGTRYFTYSRASPFVGYYECRSGRCKYASPAISQGRLTRPIPTVSYATICNHFSTEPVQLVIEPEEQTPGSSWRLYSSRAVSQSYTCSSVRRSQLQQAAHEGQTLLCSYSRGNTIYRCTGTSPLVYSRFTDWAGYVLCSGSPPVCSSVDFLRY